MFAWGHMTNKKHYLHHRNAYVYKTYHGDILWRAPTHIFAWPWGWQVRSCNKLNTLYLHLQETHGHQTRQGVVLLWKVTTLKATWPFDYVTSVTWRNKLKKLYFLFHKIYGYKTWVLTFRREFSMQTHKSLLTSCSYWNQSSHQSIVAIYIIELWFVA